MEQNEIIELIMWAYQQGYSDAAKVLTETIPDKDKLKEMFEKILKFKIDEKNAKNN